MNCFYTFDYAFMKSVAKVMTDLLGMLMSKLSQLVSLGYTAHEFLASILLKLLLCRTVAQTSESSPLVDRILATFSFVSVWIT